MSSYSVSSYPDYRSRPLDAGRYDPTSLESAHHAPRRMQHTYAPTSGSYTQDVGSYRRGTVHWSPEPSSPSPSSTASDYSTSSPRYTSSSTGYQRPSGSHSSHREYLSDAGHYHTSSPRSSSHKYRSSLSSTTGKPSEGSYLSTPPLTPEIGRLGTPDLAPLSAGLRFCPCCITDDQRAEEHEYLHGRSKMDSHVQSAMAHMSRSGTRKSGR